jgi:hypothetical protein
MQRANDMIIIGRKVYLVYTLEIISLRKELYEMGLINFICSHCENIFTPVDKVQSLYSFGFSLCPVCVGKGRECQAENEYLQNYFEHHMGGPFPTDLFMAAFKIRGM